MTSLTSYADLAQRFQRGRDYDLVVRRVPGARTAIVAPHGGSIERATSAIARALAGDEHHLYLFEGIAPHGHYDNLHLTSRLFDEPECLALLAECDQVVTVHGCNRPAEACVLIGGLDAALKHAIAETLITHGVAALTHGHAFPGEHADNVCNRGRSRRGVQLEITGALRGGPLEAAMVRAVRQALVNARPAGVAPHIPPTPQDTP